MTRLTLALAAAIVVAGCGPGAPHLPFYRTPALTPEFIGPGAPGFASIHRVGDFSLVNQAGGPVTAADLDGTIHVASFFFTSCTTVCPILRANLTAVQGAFLDDEDVRLISYSVFPETDTAAALAHYARDNGVVAGKWHLLTGPPEQIYDLARRSYFVELEDTTGNTLGELLHTETLVLVDRNRRIRGVYNGTLPYEVSHLIDDIRTLRQES